MKKRFYDSDPQVSQAVSMLLVFPVELQEVIANGLALIAEREFEAKELFNNPKSLGTEKVLSIYKSKQKKRKYDENPTVHRAMNYMLVLSPENRALISIKIVELMGFMQGYLKNCKTYQFSPERETAENLTDVYIYLGSQASADFIAAIEAEFKRRVAGLGEPVPLSSLSPLAGGHGGKEKAPQSTSPKEKRLHEEITNEGLGMKIRGDFL